MKETYNWKSLFAALAIIILGIVLCVVSAFIMEPWNGIALSVGCSLIASGLVILLHDFFVERKLVSPAEDWKLKNITSTRAEINSDCEIELEHAKRQVDIIAFGLRSFRTTHTEQQIISYLKKGVSFRILTMNPNSEFVSAREQEENNKNIKDSIIDLIDWADRINSKNSRGKIIVKGYSSMTLDFYWRVDNAVYIGPYWNGYESQQTITYKYVKGGKGFKTYTDYFDKLWKNENLTECLTKFTEKTK